MAQAKDDLMAPTEDNGIVKKMKEEEEGEEKRKESAYQNQKGDNHHGESRPKLPETGNAAVEEEEGDSASSKDLGLCCLRVRRVAAVKDVVEYQPPKSLVVVWTLMAAELGFNLTTSIIAFVSTVGTAYCCNEQIYLGPLPLSTTIPFFFLILTELGFLTRAILLTLFPSKFGHQQKEGTSNSNSGGTTNDHDDDDEGQGFEVKMQSTEVDQESNVDDEGKVDSGNNTQQRSDNEPQYVDRTRHVSSASPQRRQEQSFCRRFFCCCLKWNAKMVLTILNFLTLANPFFGCVIAWMLLYQSDKTEAFVVLGLEGVSIILHFVSVRLEGGLRTWYSKLIHSVSLLPFLVTVIIMLVYLREGGVCYVVEEELFKFSGCEVCNDGTPPVDGMCGDAALEGTGGIFGEVQNLELSNLAALADGGAKQDSFCSESINFCWYPF